MSRFHGLQASNPERKQIANTVKEGYESVRWQVGGRPPGRPPAWRPIPRPPLACAPHRPAPPRPAPRPAARRPPLQLKELDNAVNRAAENPQRFNLTVEEIGSRRKWITGTQRQVGVGVGRAPAPPPPLASRAGLLAGTAPTTPPRGALASQIEGMAETLKTATAAPVNAVESKVVKANEAFLGGERSQQQLMVK